MLKNEQPYHEEGKSIQPNMDEMSTRKDEGFSVFQQFEIPDDDFIQKLKASLHFLVITEESTLEER
ncbi:hypothetical protein [Brevibacillus choshinensis]|uniref:Uncharacterized protein n=1 Tax=Brevibacillus choshinensis TaxID=54911 RepID=A0ABX7FKG4_BRECH|nr:hypothetical protein [Brevibacillus choshinensis]QRG66204.1 hypothetical protein JNE38_22020 [Brevibacillus choshinensis]